MDDSDEKSLGHSSAEARRKLGHSLPEARRKMGQSRITNGALLVGTDGRGPWQRRARDVMAAHLSDLGIRERSLERLLTLVGSHLAHGTAGVTQPNAVAMLQESRRRPVRTRPFRPADARRFCYRSVLGAV